MSHTVGVRASRHPSCPPASPALLSWFERSLPPGRVSIVAKPDLTAYSAFAEFSFGACVTRSALHARRGKGRRSCFVHNLLQLCGGGGVVGWWGGCLSCAGCESVRCVVVSVGGGWWVL